MKLTLLIFLLFTGIILKAQPTEFKVDCGNDTVFCPRLYPDTLFHIGTKIKIFNGNPPFTYQWNCIWKSKYSNLPLTASDFLNDTTKLNPYIKGIMTFGMTFYLTVEDNDGNVATDSIFIAATKFMYSFAEYEFRLTLGDSIQFYDDTFVGGGFVPVKYYWTPSEGLSDSARIDTWCKPEKSTIYYQYIIDSKGCKCNVNSVYHITVLPTSVKNYIGQTSNSLNLHQDGERLVFNNPNGRQANLSFYSINGEKIFSAETKCSFFDIPYFLNRNSLKICILLIEGSIGTIKMF